MRFLCVALFVFCFNAFAAPQGGFSCEMIKDKAVKAACIKDKTAKEQADAEAVAKKNAEAEEKAKIDAEQKRLGEFVKKAQDILTRDFKDPMSAQFTELVVVEQPFRALCGKVNGKNSYGGYVGAKSFYVQFIGDMTDKRIVSDPKKPSEQPVYEAEINLLNLVCKDGKPFP